MCKEAKAVVRDTLKMGNGSIWLQTCYHSLHREPAVFATAIRPLLARTTAAGYRNLDSRRAQELLPTSAYNKSLSWNATDPSSVVAP